MDKTQIDELKKLNSETKKSNDKELKKSIRKTKVDLFVSKVKLSKQKSRLFVYLILLFGLMIYLFVGAITTQWSDEDFQNIVIANYFFIIFNACILLIANYEILHLNREKIPIGPKLISYFLIICMYLTPSVMYGNRILYPPGSNIDFGTTNLSLVILFIYLLYILAYILLGLWGKNNKISTMFFTFTLSSFLVFAFKGMNIFMMSSNYGLSNHGWISVVWLLLIVIFTDTFAYLGGSKLGKHKLAPTISPNKTWEGALIGFGAGTIIGIVFAFSFYNLPDYYLFPRNSEGLRIFLCITLPMFLSVFSMLGDLLFSYIKRKFEIKDFSNLLGAHGGLLDRLDSISLVFFIMFFICMTL